MFLNRLSLRKIRNIREANLTLNQKTNVIMGENAAGKTSVLESLDILSRGRSFRTNKIDLKNYPSELLVFTLCFKKPLFLNFICFLADSVS